MFFLHCFFSNLLLFLIPVLNSISKDSLLSEVVAVKLIAHSFNLEYFERMNARMKNILLVQVKVWTA